jgi:hypothetical protein
MTKRNVDGSTRDEDAVLAAVRSIPSAHRSGEPFSWPNPILNVLDCVLSLNRQYEAFCKPRVKRFSERRPKVVSLKAFLTLVESYDSPLAFSVNELNYNHKERAETLVAVVRYLVRVQRAHPGASEKQRLRRWAQGTSPDGLNDVQIRGFGLSGFQYLRALLGAQAAKPDIWIRRFVGKAIGRSVSDREALRLFEGAARKAGLPIRQVDFTVWQQMSRGARGPDS